MFLRIMYSLFAFSATCLLSFNSLAAENDWIKKIDFPYHMFTLKNGLRTIVLEDHRTPIVSVVMIYGVGSKNEYVGRRGFAHLFEHLMFNGSKNFNDDYFKGLEKIGATNTNGNTTRDRTIYFETVPSKAIDTALWLESDRMGYLTEAIDQAKLDEQRKVVLNEKRQSENEPYGTVYKDIMKVIYPQGHPYSWMTIGTTEDLEAASVKDVHEWFKTYYGASNSVLVLSGDITKASAEEKVKKYFSGMPVGAPLSQNTTWVSPRTESTTQTIFDRVPQAKLYKVWNIPESNHFDTENLNLLSDILSNGKSSRLYKRLVEKEQVATSASAGLWPGLIGSNFILDVVIRPGVPMEKVESIIQDEWQKLFKEGITQEELDRVRTQNLTSFVKSQQSTMSKAQLFAYNTLYYNDPAYYKKDLARLTEANVTSINQSSKDWLFKGEHTSRVFPLEGQVEKDTVDRSKLPLPSQTQAIVFPNTEDFELKNGMKVRIIQNPSLPLVSGSLIFTGGVAHDDIKQKGLIPVTTSMMNFGTKSKTPTQWEDALTKIGANLSVGSSMEHSVISFDALKNGLPDTLALVSELLQAPRLIQSDLDLVKKSKLDELKQELQSPGAMASRTFRKKFFSTTYPYSTPNSGLVSEKDIQGFTLPMVQGVFEKIFQPKQATLFLVGDIDIGHAKKVLSSSLEKWKAKTTTAFDLIPVSESGLSKQTKTIYLINRTGAPQSYLMVGMPAASVDSSENTLANISHLVFGGTFTARINMNLREEKGWSYGIKSQLQSLRGPRAFVVAGSVQSDKTKESLLEINKELQDYTTTKPVTQAELDRVRANLLSQMPSWLETNGAMQSQMEDLLRLNLPKDYYKKLPDAVTAATLEQVRTYSKKWIQAKQAIYVVVGDKAKIKAGLEQTNLGKVVEVDPETFQEMP